MDEIRWRSDIAAESGRSAASNPDRIECRTDIVHVISIRLDATLDDALDLLDRQERDRAARFVFERDRRRFVTAHAWMRLALASCLECPPDSLRFCFASRGKPRLVNPSIDVRFNLSHAGELALLAIALAQEVGVDVEEHRPVETTELARRFFSPVEATALKALPTSEQLAAFYRCWTRKEAFIKALGDGLTFPLDGFEVSIAHDWSPQLLRACPVAPEALSAWRIVALPSDHGYSAALAAGANAWRVVHWRAPQDRSIG